MNGNDYADVLKMAQGLGWPEEAELRGYYPKGYGEGFFAPEKTKPGGLFLRPTSPYEKIREKAREEERGRVRGEKERERELEEYRRKIETKRVQGRPETELEKYNKQINEIMGSESYFVATFEEKQDFLHKADEQRQKIIDRQKKAIEAGKKFPINKILNWGTAVRKGELSQESYIALLYSEGVDDEIIDDIATELPDPMTEWEIAEAKRKERGAQVLEEIKKELPELFIPLEEREFWFKQKKEETRIEEQKRQEKIDWEKFDLDVDKFGLDKRKELRLAGEALGKFTLDVRQLGLDEAIQKFKEAEAKKEWYWKGKYFPIDNLNAQTYYKEIMHRITRDTEELGFDKARWNEEIRQFNEGLELKWAELEDKEKARAEARGEAGKVSAPMKFSDTFGLVLQKLGTEKQDKTVKLMKSCYDSKGKLIFPKEEWEFEIAEFLFGAEKDEKRGREKLGVNLDLEDFFNEILKKNWPEEVKGYTLQCRNDTDIWQGIIEKGEERNIYGEEGQPSVWYKPWTWKRKETVETVLPEVTPTPGVTPTSPFPEYPDAYQENGVWYVIIDEKRYRIEE